jgi:hypothetical protein
MTIPSGISKPDGKKWTDRKESLVLNRLCQTIWLLSLLCEPNRCKPAVWTQRGLVLSQLIIYLFPANHVQWIGFRFSMFNSCCGRSLWLQPRVLDLYRPYYFLTNWLMLICWMCWKLVNSSFMVIYASRLGSLVNEILQNTSDLQFKCSFQKSISSHCLWTVSFFDLSQLSSGFERFFSNQPNLLLPLSDK